MRAAAVGKTLDVSGCTDPVMRHFYSVRGGELPSRPAKTPLLDPVARRVHKDEATGEYVTTGYTTPGDGGKNGVPLIRNAEFAWETWGVPRPYIFLCAIEDEGGFLYDPRTGEVLDFDLGEAESLAAGERRVVAPSFGEFVVWYIGSARWKR